MLISMKANVNWIIDELRDGKRRWYCVQKGPLQGVASLTVMTKSSWCCYFHFNDVWHHHHHHFLFKMTWGIIVIDLNVIIFKVRWPQAVMSLWSVRASSNYHFYQSHHWRRPLVLFNKCLTGSKQLSLCSFFCPISFCVWLLDFSILL